MRARARVAAAFQASPDAVYGQLATMRRYPAWVRDLRRVHPLGPRRRVWRLQTPAGSLDWVVEITVEEPERCFGFSMDAPGFSGFTSARLRDAGDRCLLWMEQDWEAVGPGAHALASWWGDPVRRLQGDVWRLGRLVQQPGPDRREASETPIAPREGAAPHGSSDLTRSFSLPSSTSLFSN